jgi:hypothetical protein
MKATELRIGNHISGHFNYNEDGEPMWIECKVLALDSVDLTEHEIWVEANGFNETYYDFKGIPLTEEWMLKFGFEKINGNYEKGMILLHGNLKTGTIDFLLHEPHSGKLHLTILDYVHQLQNLYFALTGEELIIRP